MLFLSVDDDDMPNVDYVLSILIKFNVKAWIMVFNYLLCFFYLVSLEGLAFILRELNILTKERFHVEATFKWIWRLH